MKKFLFITLALCLTIAFAQRVHRQWQNPVRSLEEKPHVETCPEGYEDLYDCKDLDPARSYWDQYNLQKQ